MAIPEAIDFRSFASKALGRYIFDARMRKRISLIQFANMLGLSDRFFIRKWEKGVQAIPIARLREVVSILELSEEKVVEIIVTDVQSKLISLFNDSSRSSTMPQLFKCEQNVLATY